MMLATPNRIVQGDGFYISFNDIDHDIYGGDTTALVNDGMTRFYILNGNHMSEYSELIPSGWNACLEYFKNHSDKNKMSDNL